MLQLKRRSRLSGMEERLSIEDEVTSPICATEENVFLRLKKISFFLA